MTELELLYGEELILSDKIKVRNFTLKDIKDLTLEKYSRYISDIILSVYDVADILWCEQKIWYEDIKSNWDFFIQRSLSGKNLKTVATIKDNKIVNIELECLFVNDEYKNALNFFFDWDYDYVALNIETNAGKQVILITVEKYKDTNIYIITENSIKITEHHYNLIVKYLKDINWIKKEYTFLKGGNKYAQKYILENEYKNRKYTEKVTVNLSSIVSALIANGQDYFSIWKYPIYLVYDLYYRTNKINEYKNTVQAYYSGCIDTKENPIKWDEVNWAAIIKK